MNVANKKIIRTAAQIILYARTHFAGGAIRKSNAQHTLERNSVHRGGMIYTACKNMGFAAAGTCQYKGRGAERFDYALLLLVLNHIVQRLR